VALDLYCWATYRVSYKQKRQSTLVRTGQGGHIPQQFTLRDTKAPSKSKSMTNRLFLPLYTG